MKERLASLAALAVLVPGLAQADRILERHAYWDQGRIHTWQRALGSDGRVRTEVLPGGTVDGIGMIQIPLFLSGVTPFVSTLNRDGVPLHWAGRCIFITPEAAGSDDLTLDQVEGALDAALSDWMDPTRDCSFIELHLVENAPGEVGFDQINLVRFREANHAGPPGTVAITTLFYVEVPGAANDGTILDADIELNGVDYSFSVDGVTLGAGVIEDLENTLAHEMGHLLGFDHTCATAGQEAFDDDGAPVPACNGALPASVTEATMYPYAAPGETVRTSIEQDDIDAVCATYPSDAAPADCAPVVYPPVDGGIEPDAGVDPVDAGVDAGPAVDAGTLVDAGGTPDAGRRPDAGTGPDASALVDSGASPDAAADAGEGGSGGGDGCDCRAGAGQRPSLAGAALALGLVVAWRRRRGRRRMGTRDLATPDS